MITSPSKLHTLAVTDLKAACAKAKRYLKALPEMREIAGKVEQTHPEVALKVALMLLGAGVGVPPKKAKAGTCYTGTDENTGIKYTRVIQSLTHKGFMQSFTRADPIFSHINKEETTHWVVLGANADNAVIVDACWNVVFSFERVGELS